MTSAAPLTQWNVRLDAETSDALRKHLASPLLVGLPKGALSEFMKEAVQRELQRRGAWNPLTPLTTTPEFF